MWKDRVDGVDYVGEHSRSSQSVLHKSALDALLSSIGVVDEENSLTDHWIQQWESFVHADGASSMKALVALMHTRIQQDELASHINAYMAAFDKRQPSHNNNIHTDFGAFFHDLRMFKRQTQRTVFSFKDAATEFFSPQTVVQRRDIYKQYTQGFKGMLSSLKISSSSDLNDMGAEEMRNTLRRLLTMRFVNGLRSSKLRRDVREQHPETWHEADTVAQRLIDKDIGFGRYGDHPFSTTNKSSSTSTSIAASTPERTRTSNFTVVSQARSRSRSRPQPLEKETKAMKATLGTRSREGTRAATRSMRTSSTTATATTSQLSIKRETPWPTRTSSTLANNIFRVDSSMPLSGIVRQENEWNAKRKAHQRDCRDRREGRTNTVDKPRNIREMASANATSTSLKEEEEVDDSNDLETTPFKPSSSPPSTTTATSTAFSPPFGRPSMFTTIQLCCKPTVNGEPLLALIISGSTRSWIDPSVAMGVHISKALELPYVGARTSLFAPCHITLPEADPSFALDVTIPVHPVNWRSFSPSATLVIGCDLLGMIGATIVSSERDSHFKLPSGATFPIEWRVLRNKGATTSSSSSNWNNRYTSSSNHTVMEQAADDTKNKTKKPKRGGRRRRGARKPKAQVVGDNGRNMAKGRRKGKEKGLDNSGNGNRT
eukprot:m.205781 g.205781  ORF g.205781 m.205781 type:complete len:659 (-) comp13751_c2_seq1:564-2540(-)